MNKRLIIGLIISGVLITSVVVAIKIKSRKNSQETVKGVAVSRGLIETIISTTGTVLPKNRLEIKPPVGGQIGRASCRERV